MNLSHRTCPRRGFTLVELIAGAALLGVGGVAMHPVLAGQRGDARDAGCKMNMMMQGQAYSAYSFTYGGQIASYTWQANTVYNSAWPPAAGPHSDDKRAAMAQQTDQLRRMTGRVDGEHKILMNWRLCPVRRYSNLILNEYLGMSALQPWSACPEDVNLLASQAQPLDESLWATTSPYNNDDQFEADAARQRFPFSSTYQSIPYAAIPDGFNDGMPFVAPVGSTSHLFFIEETQNLYGRRNFAEIVYPSLKVHTFEHNDFHRNAGDPFYAYEQAECNQLFFDGSVDDLRSGDAQAGWDPSNPDSPDTFYYEYTPLSTEPIPLGDPEALLPVRYRFTREGLAGFDYQSRTQFKEAPGRVPR